MRLHPGERAVLVGAHQPAVAGDVGRQDRRQPALVSELQNNLLDRAGTLGPVLTNRNLAKSGNCRLMSVLRPKTAKQHRAREVGVVPGPEFSRARRLLLARLPQSLVDLRCPVRVLSS